MYFGYPIYRLFGFVGRCHIFVGRCPTLTYYALSGLLWWDVCALKGQNIIA
jgi:hypothetical protein